MEVPCLVDKNGIPVGSDKGGFLVVRHPWPSLMRTIYGDPARYETYWNTLPDIYFAGGDVRGGSGVIVLPCGAGKTIVGIAAMAAMQRSALVLTTSITAVRVSMRRAQSALRPPTWIHSRTGTLTPPS